MPEVELLTGWFGSVGPYAMNGFETMSPGLVTKFEGQTQNGDVQLLDTASHFGEPR